jgi:hypothetical protein
MRQHQVWRHTGGKVVRAPLVQGKAVAKLLSKKKNRTSR